ncbi:tRNA endonuclease ANKZF1-like [Haliotis cracherodii]|uniref:tRNA endonuclease ANKZF1-like n=1 Tax=Haliotis cracherodii TaxID=6455 RepID=UPI0039EC177A
MEGGTRSPRKLPKKKSQHYSSCMLYHGRLAQEKLCGITIATCNPSVEDDDRNIDNADSDKEVFGHHHHRRQHVVSDKMSCNFCSVEFTTRRGQKEHYKSDWHRYNLKLRLKGSKFVCEDEFEKIAGDVSSISGSEDESEMSDTDTDTGGGRGKSKPMAIPQHVRGASAHSGTDSESEGGLTIEGTARKYPKVYFKNKEGELISVFRCLLYHKKKPPSTQAELIATATDLPQKTKWAICMTAGGHFAAAVFEGETLVVHKTFHRYVVRAKRGTAQSSRDSQGNAPKSAGASIRRHNEAALIQEVQDLLTSWSEHLKKCDLIFLRAPSFNRQMFYASKNPPFKKDDVRIRTVPFPTRRPTLNEVKRVHQMLASVECYGEEGNVKDFLPMSPLRHFSPETGRLEIVSEDSLRRSPRKLKDKDLSVSPLAASPKFVSGSPSNKQTGKFILPDHLLCEENQPSSSATSTASEADLVEMEETISTLDLQQLEQTGKRPRRKKNKRQRRPSLKHQVEPEGDLFAEERYHLRNALYTACKVGDKSALRSLLAIFNHPAACVDSPLIDDTAQQGGQGAPVESGEAEVLLPLGVDKGEEISQVDKDGGATPEEKENISESVFETENVEDESFHQGEGDYEIKVTDCGDIDSEIVSNNGQEYTGNVDPLKDEDEISEIVHHDRHKNGETLEKESSEKMTSTKPAGLPGLTLGLAQPTFELSPLFTVEVLNEPFGDNSTTLLHVASKGGHPSLIRLLMKAGADPAVKDKFGKVPYSVTTSKETRNEFRRFMGEFPEKFDYSKAQIPSALTPEMEAEKRVKDAEKKKQQKKAKQERLKEKKVEMAKTRAEEEEKKRYLSLSDREKRALAAERRILQQQEVQGTAPSVLSRCWQCGTDTTGKVPFEYKDYKFCSPKCLQLHRKSCAKS